MKSKSKYKTSSVSHLKPSAILTCLVIWLQMLEKFPVQCGTDNVFLPNLPMNPDVYRFLQEQQQQQSSKGKQGELKTRRENSGESIPVNAEDVESHKAIEGLISSSDRGHSDSAFNFGGYQRMQNRFGDLRETAPLNQQEGVYGDLKQQHQLQQLAPAGFLFPKQFSKPSNSMIFNQANGPFMEKELSEESETNGRLGLFNSFNEYDLPHKHVVVRQRPPNYLVGGGGSPTIKRSQSIASAREGYMCHFKLCQLGASGKRRWSPLFEFD